jgi:hypothetical protein
VSENCGFPNNNQYILIALNGDLKYPQIKCNTIDYLNFADSPEKIISPIIELTKKFVNV